MDNTVDNDSSDDTNYVASSNSDNSTDEEDCTELTNQEVCVSHTISTIYVDFILLSSLQTHWLQKRFPKLDTGPESERERDPTWLPA